MTQVGKRTAVIPMRSDKGMWAINPNAPGDAAEVPDGYAISLHNYLNRPLRQIRRPPFVYDSLMNVANLLRWEDMVNQLTKTLAIDASQNLRTKDSTGLGYTATVVTGTPTGRLTDFANFLGKAYQMYDNGSGTPAGASVYDGSAVSASPFNTPIASRTITAFIERLFLAYPRVTISNLIAAADIQTCYDWTLNGCVKTNVNAMKLVNGAAKTFRLAPTSTASRGCKAFWNNSGNSFIVGSGGLLPAIGSNSVDKPYLYQLWVRAVDSAYDLPITVQITAQAPGPGLLPFAYNVGDAIVRSGFMFRCTTAGSVNGAEPAWNTTIGGRSTWNAAVFTNIGSQVLASQEFTVVNASASPNWTPLYLPMVLPWASATGFYGISVELDFWNTNTAALTTLAPLDVGYEDGLSDSDVSKQSYGQQITLGDFYYPFFNQESSSTATQNLDAIVWSEIREPKRILAKNTFTLPEIAGLPTAACQVGGRYLVFKRRGFWVFKRTTDKNIPILPEKPANTEVGCIGPRAWDTYGEKGDTLYWIGENGIYRMGDDWQPEEIGGAAMREEIMARGSGWVESQATYNVPFLVVEHANKEVWVHTQAGKIYVYHIPTGAWSYIDVSGAPPIRTMFYDYVGGRMLVSFGGFGVTRLMETSTAKDTIDNTATPLTVTADVVYKPLELYAPRYEAYLEEVGVFHLATASQAGQTITPSYSYDRGATFTTPTGYPATVNLTSPRVRLPIGAMGPSVTVKISASGGGGQANWSMSKADAKLQVKRGELPYVNAATA